jgi:tight adherence protein C
MWASTVFLLLITSGICATVALFQHWRPAYKKLAARLNGRGELVGGRKTLARESLELGGFAGTALQWQLERMSKQAANRRALQRIGKLLQYAGFNRLEGLAIFRLLRWLVTIVGAAAGALLGIHYGYVWPFLVLFAIGSYLVPELILKRIAEKRQLGISRELSGVLDLLIASVEAGMGLGEAIKIVGNETAKQGSLLGKAMSVATAETSAGLSLQDSLLAMADRIGLDEIRSLVSLLIQSERIGARLGPALRSSASMLNSMRRMRAEEAAQKTTIKMLFPLVFMILPAMMILILGPAIIQIIELIGA